MPLTNFPNGVSSFGVPILPAMGGSSNPYATHYFVDAKVGTDALTAAQNDPDHPFLTMSRAFAVIKSGDVIHVRGKVREQLNTPAGVFDVSIIGAGNRPRHADDHTESLGLRGSSAATWAAPSSGSTAIPLLSIYQQGWRVQGITFQIDGNADAAIYLHKTDDSGDDERDGGHAEISYCKIQGNPTTPVGNGIEVNGIGFFGIYNNLFLGLVNGLVKVGSAGGQVGWAEIVGNRFSENTNGIVAPLYKCTVSQNQFLGGHTLEYDFTGGQDNMVINNYFNGNDAFETNINGTNDMFFPNYAGDAAATNITAAPDQWQAAIATGS